MAKTKVISAISGIFGLAGFAFALVAICTNYWLSAGEQNSGLWRVCNNDNCENLKIGSNRNYAHYEMVRGFGVLTVTLACIGTIVAMISIFRKISPSVVATFFLMAAFFGLICIALFTSLSRETTFSWGYSFGLGWASFPATFIAGIMMTVVELTSSDD